MKQFCLLDVVCGCFFLLISTSVNAALVTPAGLNPGDEYHVIFVTSGATGPMSSNIADYDTFVQSAANAAGIGSTLGLSWRVVGSTSTIDAKDHIQPLFSGSTADVPIYNQNGDLVASSFNTLWSGSILNPVKYNELGNDNGNLGVYTGTLTDGTVNPGYGLDGSYVTYGNATSTISWIQTALVPRSFQYALYGISEQLTVPGVPVPAAIWLFGSGLIGLIGVARRR